MSVRFRVIVPKLKCWVKYLLQKPSLRIEVPYWVPLLPRKLGIVGKPLIKLVLGLVGTAY